MSTMQLDRMRAYLSSSMASLNQNKLRGTIAEIDLRNYLAQIGFGDRVSPGGWIARRKGNIDFAHSSVALFPEIISPGGQYPANRVLPNPSHGLHTICTTFHQSGISSFYCAAVIPTPEDCSTMNWHAVELGLPVQQDYQPLVQALVPLHFRTRERPYNYLRYHTDAASIPDAAVAEEFSKEHLRVSFNTAYMAEISDIDGIFWGRQYTYPIEIKEKTPAPSNDMGPYFGVDIGPFVKLASYSAERGILRPLYILREIDHVEDRNLVQWWFITLDHMAHFASRTFRAGGHAMGGASSVVRIPRQEFQPLNEKTIAQL
jgi:hypothetical protein